MSSLASSAPISSSVMGGLRRLEVSNPGAIPSPSQAAQKLSESGSSPVPSQRLHRSTIVRKKHWSVRSHPTETRHPSCLYQRRLTALGFRAVRSASIELRMLNEGLPQFPRRLHPVRSLRQEDATGTHAVDLGVVYARRNRARAHVGLNSGDQSTPDADDHGVGAAEMLPAAVVDWAHAPSHGCILHRYALDAGEPGWAVMAPLQFAVDEEVVAQVLFLAETPVPVGGVR